MFPKLVLPKTVPAFIIVQKSPNSSSDKDTNGIGIIKENWYQTSPINPEDTLTIKSMTAFGSSQVVVEETTYRCEIKTLNSRFIDVSVYLPRRLQALEIPINQFIKKTFKRGKIDISLEIVSPQRDKKLPQLNLPALIHYGKLVAVTETSLSEQGLLDRIGISPLDILGLEGVLQSPPSKNSDDLVNMHRTPVLDTVKLAADQVLASREREGAALCSALTELIRKMDTDRLAISENSQEIQLALFQNHRSRLEKFFQKLTSVGEQAVAPMDQEQLVREVAIMADKTDIQEELTRLQAHQAEFLKDLQCKTEIGRKLDFMCQEMHREINTMSNKVVHLDVIQFTMSLKQTVEQIKQQVQNIE